MEKKDLYLSEQQLENVLCEAGFTETLINDGLVLPLIASKASADYAVKKVVELIEELEEDPAKYYDLLGKVATLGDLKYGLLKLAEDK